MSIPLVAIVGRPNVGKSTLFNRLIGRREAIVTDIPGTTRDRLLGDVSRDGCRFTLVDTGGLEPRPQDSLRDQVRAQVEVAVSEADLVIFLMDVMDGVTPVDRDIVDWLRRSSKPLVPAVNKVDNEMRELSAAEFQGLGLKEPLSISAYHNIGIYALMARVASLLPDSEPEVEEADEGVMRLAIVGRTNVGKSMLTNSILGQERSIVSPIPGTTRDAVDTDFTYEGRPVVLIDTAGIRRPGKLGKGIEYFSVLRAMRAVQRCDIALLVMDAAELATTQDAHISGEAWEQYRGLIAVVNKWDLVLESGGTEMELAIQTVRQRLHFAPYVPICFTSALNGQGIHELMALAIAVHRERLMRVPPIKLRPTLMSALADQLPRSKRGKRPKIEQLRQVDVNPPTFAFAVKNPELMHFAYIRYLENRLRSALGYTHTHLRLVFKRRV